MPVPILRFTFHNVSINTGEQEEIEKVVHSALHSTMFLLIQKINPHNDPRIYIYIPQCFY